MITISKPKVTATFAILIMLLLPSLPYVNAVTYTATLPSDTILFEDFQGTTNTWHTNDSCTNGKAAFNSTYAFPGLSKSFLLFCPTASQIEDAHWAFGAPRQNENSRIKFSVLFFPTAAMNTTANSGDISFSNEAWDPNTHWEGKLIYTARVCTWKLFYGSGGLSFQIEKLCVPTDFNTVPLVHHLDQTWSLVTMTVDWQTKKYVEVCTADTCFSASQIEQLQSGGSVIRSIGAAGAGWTPENFHSVELSRDTGTVASPGNYGTHFANLLVEDVTPGQTPCGPLCLSAVGLSLWFGLIMVSVGGGGAGSLFMGASRIMRGEPFKSKEVLVLVGTGIAAILGLAFMIFVVSNAAPLVPGG